MAVGLPVVTFDSPVSREILGDIGIYAQMGSVEDLAEKIALLLEDPPLAAQLGAAGRHRAVAEFSWEQAARQLESIYTLVLPGKTPLKYQNQVVRDTGEVQEKNLLA
jgi:glycosyltransferase involved in cell wall biosynthesis